MVTYQKKKAFCSIINILRMFNSVYIGRSDNRAGRILAGLLKALMIAYSKTD